MAKKTKLSSGAKGTGGMLPAPAPYKQTGYWGNMWNNIRWPTITSDPTDRGLPDYLTYSPQSTWGFPVPAYGGVMNPGARGGWNTGTPTIVPQYPEWDAAVNAYNASQAANAPPSGVPLYGVTRNLAQPVEYASQLVGGAPAYGEPAYGGYTANGRNYAGPGYNWTQEYYTPAYKWVRNDKTGDIELQMNPEAEGAVESAEGWKSSYSADFYKNQWLKEKTYGLAGRNGNVTQLQYGRSQPDWVRKLKPNPLKPKDTNKTYDQSILEGTNPPAARMSYPAWAGDLTTWRT